LNVKKERIIVDTRANLNRQGAWCIVPECTDHIYPLQYDATE